MSIDVKYTLSELLNPSCDIQYFSRKFVSSHVPRNDMKKYIDHLRRAREMALNGDLDEYKCNAIFISKSGAYCNGKAGTKTSIF